MKKFFPSLLLVLALAVTFPVTAWATSSAPNSVYEQSLYTGWSYNANNNSFTNNGGANVSYNKTFLDLLLNNFKGINYQLSGSSGPNTSGTSLYTLINNIYSSLTSTSNGTILSYMSSDSQKLSQINTTLGTGTSLKNVMTNLDAIVSWTSQTFNILQHGLSVTFDSDTTTNIANTSTNTGNTADNTSNILAVDSSIYSVINSRFNTPYSYNVSAIRRSSLEGNYLSVNMPSYSRLIWRDNSTYPGLIDLFYASSGSGNFSDYLAANNSNLLALASILRTLDTDYVYRYYDSTSGQLKTWANGNNRRVFLSVDDFLLAIYERLELSLGRFTDLYADADTVQAKNNNKLQEDAFLNNFTGSGSAAASASDFTNVAAAANDFSSGFSGGASFDNTFNFMDGDSDAWDWFTQQAADDLDNVQARNTRRLLRSSSDTPLLDEYFNSIFGFLGGGS